jgi:hypothetical protein
MVIMIEISDRKKENMTENKWGIKEENGKGVN